MASPFLIWPLVARSVEEQWSANATIRRLCREFGFEHAVFQVGSVGAIERLIVNVGRASWHQFSALPPRYESCEGERGAPYRGSSGTRRSLFSPLFFCSPLIFALHPYLLCTHGPEVFPTTDPGSHLFSKNLHSLVNISHLVR